MGQKARSSQAKSFRTDAFPTTDQGKGSAVKAETIKKKQHRQCPDIPERNVMNIRQCQTETNPKATLQEVTDKNDLGEYRAMFSLIRGADCS